MRATTSVASPVFIMHKLEVTIIETIALCDLAVGGVMIVRVHTDAGATGIGQRSHLRLRWAAMVANKDATGGGALR